ncbi:PREDICTED: TBC1 domain family member 21-like, partial [Gekko japonicus]|uniref:TBC1 domain family member 21-like n=1 Tax=Gekko japonicus TaxID=146911 RepID=A0ABM1KU53_GEKJA
MRIHIHMKGTLLCLRRMSGRDSGMCLFVTGSKYFSQLKLKKMPIDRAEWESYFDESGHLLKSQEFVSSQILERGLDPAVRPEAWKFLTGYYSWQTSHDERLTIESMRRKSYESLCNMCDKIRPLLETEHRQFMEVRNFIKSDVQRLYIKDAQGNSMMDKSQLEKILLLNYVCNVEAEYQQGFHEMLLLFRLFVEKEHEIYWLFQFFLQKTNAVAPVLMEVLRTAHVHPVLRELHWLPVEYQIRLKALNSQGPMYLQDPLFQYTPRRALRSVDQNLR